MLVPRKACAAYAYFIITRGNADAQAHFCCVGQNCWSPDMPMQSSWCCVSDSALPHPSLAPKILTDLRSSSQLYINAQATGHRMISSLQSRFAFADASAPAEPKQNRAHSPGVYCMLTQFWPVQQTECCPHHCIEAAQRMCTEVIA